jgi:hypothetical protein
MATQRRRQPRDQSRGKRADREATDIEVHVVLCARQRHHAIVTSDPRDIARIDPTVPRILV